MRLKNISDEHQKKQMRKCKKLMRLQRWNIIVTADTRTNALNPLMDTGNYSATSNNMKLVHWPLMGGLLHLVQRGGTWAGCSSFHNNVFNVMAQNR